ncbi:hypothetical protein NB636_02365 [Oxalobacter aliiformigenes]|uniref:hypothetical protein n=1 Tax=Oxalobacter aliiformigenes TaxID=2946593 RepID=UPI0022AFC1B6|nr:hypothetical protein [Oxalobacter aliiformigenes]MCZ4064376.1 hypothetical protein [Oxalobacter aliiformigenes]WAV99727.1 hypothetical protein NB636_02365 [Oxalobacter aliiformigenes]
MDADRFHDNACNPVYPASSLPPYPVCDTMDAGRFHGISPIRFSRTYHMVVHISALDNSILSYVHKVFCHHAHTFPVRIFSSVHGAFHQCAYAGSGCHNLVYSAHISDADNPFRQHVPAGSDHYASIDPAHIFVLYRFPDPFAHDDYDRHIQGYCVHTRGAQHDCLFFRNVHLPFLFEQDGKLSPDYSAIVASCLFHPHCQSRKKTKIRLPQAKTPVLHVSFTYQPRYCIKKTACMEKPTNFCHASTP